MDSDISGLFVFILGLGLIALAVTWIVFPAFALSKLTEMRNLLREIRDDQRNRIRDERGQNERENTWSERSDTLLENIEKNTRPK